MPCSGFNAVFFQKLELCNATVQKLELCNATVQKLELCNATVLVVIKDNISEYGSHENFTPVDNF